MPNYNYNSIITEIKKVRDDLAIIKVKPKNDKKISYIPGQYALLALEDTEGNWIPRAYSLSSAPSSGEYEFYIVRVPNGKLTTLLFNKQVGDEIYMGERIMGFLNLNGIEDDTNLILMSTGTGLTPYVSMAREYFNYDKTNLNDKNEKLSFKNMVILHGVFDPSMLGFREELETLAKTHSNFHYIPVLDPSCENWNGYKGFVQDILENGELEKIIGEQITHKNSHIYLCGNPLMINANTKLYTEKGYTKKAGNDAGNLHIEAFFKK
jgi:ferredoxin--NADP+ reductase